MNAKFPTIFWHVGKSWHNDLVSSVILRRSELNLPIRIFSLVWELRQLCYILFCHKGITMTPENEVTAKFVRCD